MDNPPQPASFGCVFNEGDVLFREGDVPRVVYIIQEGSVRLSKTIDGESTVIAELAEGEFVGEVGVVRSRPQPTTATAMRRTRCLAVDGATLERMVTADGEI